MGEVIDIIEENYVNTVTDLVDWVCQGDAELQKLHWDSVESTKSHFYVDRKIAYDRVIARKTVIIKSWLAKQKTIHALNEGISNGRQ
jgi:hypothetical protein